MIGNELSKIWLTPNAARLNERIHVSCPVAETPKEVRSILSSGRKVSLEELWPYFKVSPVNFLIYAKKNKKNLLDVQDLLEIFGGKSHFDECKSKIDNPYNIIPASGQIFSERMKEIGMNLETKINQAEFVALDILTFGKLLQRFKSTATIQVGKVIFTNVALPKKLQTQNEFVAMHYGAVMISLGKMLLKKIKPIRLYQLTNPLFLRSLFLLEDRQIDCSNCCKDSKGKGFNLTKWFSRK